MNLFRVSAIGILLLVCASLPEALRSTALTTTPTFAAQGMNFTVEGKITRLEQQRITLNTQENMIFRVRYDDKTEIKKKDGSPGTAKDLRVGLRIRADGELTESGEVIAQRIELL